MAEVRFGGVDLSGPTWRVETLGAWEWYLGKTWPTEPPRTVRKGGGWLTTRARRRARPTNY